METQSQEAEKHIGSKSASAKYILLKAVLFFIYLINHVYDYICYPIYFVYYHPWRVRRYKKSTHARREDIPGGVIFHSLTEPTKVNREIEEQGLDTMDQVFNYICKQYLEQDCLGTREIIEEEDEIQSNGKTYVKYILGDYKWRTFSNMKYEVDAVSVGLKELGLERGSKLAILADTRAEWMILANACFQRSIVVVTLYTNLGNDGLVHAINETEVSVLVCSEESMAKVQEMLPACGHVKSVILLNPSSPKKRSRPQLQCQVIPYDWLLNSMQTGDPSRQPPLPQDCAIIMYTSGSTGTPKGVMLSHKNLLSAMKAIINIAEFRAGDRYIAYLPLAHVLELLAETSCMMYGIKIGYSSPATLTNKSSKVKAGCKGDANILRPTLMCSVPMVLERIYKSIVDTMKRQGWAVEELFHYFMSYKMKWEDRGFDTPLLNKTLFRKIRYFLGGRVRLMLSGGAPLSSETHSLTRTCICVPVLQGYGLTETTACATVTNLRDRTTTRVGAPLMDVKIKLVNWDDGGYFVSDKPFSRGEIHIGGDIVSLGYYKLPERNEKDFYEEDGVRWFRTGDIGEVQGDGVLKIIDRMKDLVKLQQGEYISCGKVESILKNCFLVENICLVADSSKDYLIAIILPDKDQLTSFVRKSLQDCAKDPECLKMVALEIQDFGKRKGLNRTELPQKIIIADGEWTPESGLVTAALKIRRRQIVMEYRNQIEKVYV